MNNDIEQVYLDFISTVSHEMRTPLTSIKGFADTLIISGEQLTQEQKIKFLKIIKEQSDRLIKLVENLLTVSKINTDESLFIYKSVNVCSIVEQVVQIVKAQYPTHIFKSNIKEHVPQILVDIDKFQQIMLNLIENAAKYSQDGKKVFINIMVEESKYLAISVCDEGVGIEEKYFEKIFEKFSRIDNPLTRKVQGSGLGLFITKQLVEKMNGEILVKSSPNGSEFKVLFPIVTPDKQTFCKIKESY